MQYHSQEQCYVLNLNVIIMKLQFHVKIFGKVQGVWFRANTKNKADEFYLTGWVKNTNDGGVEAIFEGEENNLKNIINWCLKGPPSANVEKIEIHKKEFTNKFHNFSIIP